ncbi:MAG: DUF4350 domain-containing protein [Chloroflexota bacterium]
MSTSRDLILIALVLLLTGALIIAGAQQYVGRGEGYGSLYSMEASGTQRFAAQLSNWGYQVVAEKETPLLPDMADTALFVMGVSEDFNDLETSWLRIWVQSGGTLLVAQDNGKTRRLLQSFNINLKRTWSQVETAPLQLPVFNWPQVGTVTLQTHYAVDVPCGYAAIHVGDCDTPLLVLFGYGNGQVIVLSSLYPFTNEGLQAPGNAQFVTNLVQTAVPTGSQIRFDEAHRPHTGAARAWLLTTPTGWALLYTVLLLLIYAWWQGRSLQTAVPVTATTAANEFAATQSTDEFITDMANLYQQSSQEKNIQHHFWQRLKRQLARKYHCDYNLPEAEFFTELLPYQDEIDIATLISLHTSLQNQESTSSQLVWWVTQVIEFTEALDFS